MTAMLDVHKPLDAQIWIDGCWYKVGRHDLPFVWVNNQWRRTTKTAHEINKAIAGNRRN